MSEVQGKVTSLRKELQAAEMEEAMNDKSMTMHMLEPHGSADGPVLRPTLCWKNNQSIASTGRHWITITIVSVSVCWILELRSRKSFTVS